MALSLTITRLLPMFPNGVYFQWDLVNPTEHGMYIFSVYRSGSPEGPWETLQNNEQGIYSYWEQFRPDTDTATRRDTNQLSLMRGIYYKVTCTPPSGPANMVSAISDIEPRLDGRQKMLKRKILRDESIMLRKLNGVELAVLKRMHWGPRCTKCWDATTKQVTRGSCTTCYGTGFSPGYFNPIITLGRRGTVPKAKQVSPQGVSEYAPTQVTILDAPKVEPDDILVFLRDNRRFIVKAQMQTELKTVAVHQKLEVSELARSDVAYRIQVDPVRTPRLF